MDGVERRSNRELRNCRQGNARSGEILSKYLRLLHRNDPLREPEITVTLTEDCMLPLVSFENLEQDIFDYEHVIISQEDSAEFEENVHTVTRKKKPRRHTQEQIVPSIQLNNIDKYPNDDVMILDDQIDEGIFENDPTLYDSILMNNNNRYDSQPP